MINAALFCKQETDSSFSISPGLLGRGRVHLSSVLCLLSWHTDNDGIGCAFGPVHGALTLCSAVPPNTKAKGQRGERSAEGTWEKLWHGLLRLLGEGSMGTSASH